MARNKKKLIGHVCVDTATIAICDPVHIGRVAEMTPEEHIEGGNLLNENNVPVAVISSTGWGDGRYPVFAHIDEEGRVAQITIKFL